MTFDVYHTNFQQVLVCDWDARRCVLIVGIHIQFSIYNVCFMLKAERTLKRYNAFM